MAVTPWKIILWLTLSTESYRVFDGRIDEYEKFEPYSLGFVGRVDLAENFVRERVNEGSLSVANQWDRYVGAQVCPGMVGPIGESYFCRGKEFGFCDRRTGVCHCEMGYQGVDCSECTSTHFMRGGLCYPKRLCPETARGLCSGAGECDYASGECRCMEHRTGPDCSKPRCQSNCIECTNSSCVLCEEGFYVSQNGCRSCAEDIDPRCFKCDSLSCLECVDPLLLSIRRSGQRERDPDLPFDEQRRELVFAWPYGSHDPKIFDEAEPYRVIQNITLRDRTHGCDQQQDASFLCTRPVNVSHVVCGHEGTLSWSSPTYAVPEEDGLVRLTIRRTGGGVGAVSVRYAVHHVTTDASDVSATLGKTTATRLFFEEGAVETSVLLVIHDDRMMEGDERFFVDLVDPRGGAVLGPQFRASVVIIDDDAYKTTSGQFAMDPNGIAGSPAALGIAAFSGAGTLQRVGGDVFLVDLHHVQKTTDRSIRTYALQDLGNGTYVGNWTAYTSGEYDATAYLAVPGGLLGDYCQDTFFMKDCFSRVDRAIDFDWGLGPLAGAGSATTVGPDFASVQWRGRLRPDMSGWYNVTVIAEGDGLSARLWIDNRLTIDWSSESSLTATRDLRKGEFYEIVLQVRVTRYAGPSYRKENFPGIIRGKRVALAWALDDEMEVIPAENLYSLNPLPEIQRVTVVSAVTDAAASFVDAPHINVDAGQALTFTVQLRDAFENRRNDVEKYLPFPAAAKFYHPLATSFAALAVDATVGLTANLTLETAAPGAATRGSRNIAVSFEFENDTAVGTAFPTIAGVYRVDVAFQPNSSTASAVSGSPFQVTTIPAQALAATSRAVLKRTSIAGEDLFVQVVAVDALGNDLRRCGDDFRVVSKFIYEASDDWSRVGAGTFRDWQALPLVVDGSVVDFGNGTYEAAVRPKIAGRHDIYVQLHGLDVDHSPYVVLVNHANAEASSSTAEGSGLLRAQVNVTATITVTARDRFGNPAIEAHNFTLRGPGIDGTCPLSFGNGSLLCTYVPMVSGPEVPLGIFYNDEAIRSSPFSVNVADGRPFGPETTVQGEGLRAAEAGVPAFFVITATDIGSNVVDDGLSLTNMNVSVFLNHSITGGISYVGDVHALSDGDYLATYTAGVAGIYDLHIRIGGLAVMGSPFTPFVRPTFVSAFHSTVDGVSDAFVVACKDHDVIVTAFDRFGNRHLNSTSLAVYAEVTVDAAENGSTTTTTTVERRRFRVNGRPLDRGRYDLAYVPQVAGTHFLEFFFLEPGVDVELYGEADLTRFLGHRVEPSVHRVVYSPAVEPGHYLNDIVVNRSNVVLLKRSDYYSIRWRGLLRFPKVETAYALRLEAGDGASVRLVIDDINVLGTGLVGNGTLPDSSKGPPWEGVFTPRFVQKKKKDQVHGNDDQQLEDLLHPFVLEYQGDAEGSEEFVRLFWKVPGSANWTLIPEEAYLRSVRLQNTTFRNTVYPGEADADASTVAETAAEYPAASWESVGIVEVRDKCGNLRALPDVDPVAVVAYGSQTKVATISSLGNGRYRATMLFEVAGEYTMIAVVGDNAVAVVRKDVSRMRAEEAFLGSMITRSTPWVAIAVPGTVSALTSSAVGMPLVHGVVAGEQGRIAVVLRDATYNEIPTSAVNLTAWLVLREPSSTSEVVVVVDKIQYTRSSLWASLRRQDVVTKKNEFELPVPVIAGRYDLFIQLNEDIAGSPYRIECRPGSANAAATGAVGSVPTVARAGVHAEPSRRFRVQARDRFWNDHSQGGAIFRAFLRGVGTSVGIVDDRGDGTYAVRLSSANLTSGSYEVDVDLLLNDHQGLTGHYFTNGGLRGPPSFARIDSGPSEYFSDVVSSIRWTGFLRIPRSAAYTFTLAIQEHDDDDKGRFFLGGRLVVDSGNLDSAPIDLVHGAVYDVTLEMESATFIALRWSTDDFGPQAIPEYFLFPGSTPINGSPFPLRLVDEDDDALNATNAL